MTRTNQGGSVLGFVIVGIVLAGLLIGGIYVVKRSSTQPQSPPAPAPTQNPPEPQKPAKDPAPSPNQPRETQPAPESLPSGNPPAGPTQLPATGPKETVGTLLILGLLGAMAASYVQSRRLQLSL